ncbi:hypothetical protein BDV96DRAFT_652019 [Lophiotrema nucula]|uniref:Rhodopsin domain-containing protein n=1 Tax=Lophiotrema nucula TaxID=690887 RepID=A0A6A5YSN0_9PLEO|nr:hypothetical protein BDV96DRAFT_652019 [Lophiotrema nucula]
MALQNPPNENEGSAILGATFTVTIVALVTMITRLYVRLRMIRNVGWDDYVMIAAMVLCIVGQCLIVPEVLKGAGRHKQYIPATDFQLSFKLNFITQPIYLIAICLVKISIGFFLLRLAVTPFYRRTIIFIMGFMAFYTTGCFLTIMLQCTNLAVQWDPTAQGTCWGKSTLMGLSYTNVALNITTDLLLAIVIPVPMLWNVQMNRRQKSSIIGILGLGVFATAAALVKISFLPEYGKTGDWLWDSRNITIWTVVECNVGIIGGNLPCMKPLFKSVLGSTYGRGSRKTTPKYLSRPYGAGTGHGTKNYSSLTSGRTQEEGFRTYGDESYRMKAMVGHKDRSASAGSLNESPGKNSAESVVWLNDHHISGKMGGITKTTEVNITGSTPVEDQGIEDGRERREAHIV